MNYYEDSIFYKLKLICGYYDKGWIWKKIALILIIIRKNIMIINISHLG